MTPDQFECSGDKHINDGFMTCIKIITDRMIVNMIMVGVPSYQKIPRLHKKGSVTDKQTGGALPRDDKEPQSNSI